LNIPVEGIMLGLFGGEKKCFLFLPGYKGNKFHDHPNNDFFLETLQYKILVFLQAHLYGVSYLLI
jgi:hypothetical protein